MVNPIWDKAINRAGSSSSAAMIADDKETWILGRVEGSVFGTAGKMGRLESIARFNRFGRIWLQ